MAERVKITVTPPGAVSNLLKVEDAMKQVLDYFDLLGDASKAIDGENQIVWLLTSVTTNSPFTVEAEPIGADPTENVDAYARSVKAQLYHGIKAVIEGGEIPDWLKRNNNLNHSLNRNLNGVGTTHIDFGKHVAPITINHRIAGEAQKNLQEKYRLDDFTHTAHGSIEGIIKSVGTHFNRPAFKLRTRLSELEIWCKVEDQLASEIGSKHNLYEIWGEKRVMVEGQISYDYDGFPKEVDVDRIVNVSKKDVQLESILDPTFTGDLTAAEYLEKLREGGLD